MIRFRVRVHPGSRVALVGGSFDGSLEVRVRSRAVGGAATEEALALLARAFGVRPAAVQCTRGGRSRTKTIVIEGDEGRLSDRLAGLLETT